MDEPPAIERRNKPRIRAALSRFPAVAILGPRQVGKTTLALSLAEEMGQQAIYLDLELPSDRAKAHRPGDLSLRGMLVIWSSWTRSTASPAFSRRCAALLIAAEKRENGTVNFCS